MKEKRMNENQNEVKYSGYSKEVVRYHGYDYCIDVLSENKDAHERFIAEVKKRQLIILAGMNEDEYQELQKSFEGHIVQKRIYLDSQRKTLLKLAEESPDGKIYIYCVESIDEDMTTPLEVFGRDDLDEARRYAREAYENRTDESTIQVSEGLFDSEGNMLGEPRIAFVVETWGD